ncbi:hypothetical protein NQ314_013278 [Rhamnusium bicolor]|uniref:Uncharacterized protein n=1 Tax=Rhamnusium bicolor TaxID=1586634 RepID=A0AAV8X7W4_9CUCU|nr:hypothetical protein NQ314_013278 [Rhamnusium bicolor]
MADDDKAKKDFNDILSNINRKFEIIHTKWESDSKQFEIKLRTQIPRDNEDFNSLCDEWVDLFSEVTNTVWAKKISNTGPKIRFRKQYQCWTQGGKVIQKELLFDARRCKATLDMKVLTDNPLSRRKNKHIRMGLNVVVKMNFYHLHSVDTTQHFAFFVHNCDPQLDVPKPVIQPNERLPQLIAAMVQNGPSVSQKAAEKAEKCIARLNNNEQKLHTNPQQLVVSYAGENSQQLLLQDSLNLESQSVELVQNVSLQTLENVKLEGQSQVQHSCTQFVVTPQFDMSEHFLMCQPLMFETSQVIPLSTHSLPSHFVQVQSTMHNQNSQFL